MAAPVSANIIMRVGLTAALLVAAVLGEVGAGEEEPPLEYCSSLDQLAEVCAGCHL